MRIDLHCHTIATKSGEVSTRNVDKETFIRKISGSNVKIVAITNHNAFDYDQFLDFTNEHFQVWPGIELDVSGNNSKGHLILIADPKNAMQFNLLISQIVGSALPSAFDINIVDLCKKIRDYKLIVVAHYGNKKPNFSDEDITLLKSLLTSKVAFFLEPQTLRSAAIYCAHDLNAIVGSDHHDWETYPGKNKDLPELKLPIENFEKFMLLVKKTPQVIKTFIDQKLYGVVDIQPFTDCKLSLEIYYDINVIFGGKGTGKTEILKSLEKKFQQSGILDVAKYYANEKQATFAQMTAVNIEKDDFKKLKIDDCSDSFKLLREWNEKNVTTTRKYYEWCRYIETETHTKEFGFLNATFNEIIDIQNYNKALDFHSKYNDNISSLIVEDFKEYLSINDSTQMKMYLGILKEAIDSKVIDEFCKLKALELEKFTINKMKSIIKSKKGIESKPSGTGLIQQYEDSIAIHSNASKILNALSTPQKDDSILLGRLIDKGNIYLKRTILVNPELANAKFTYKLGKSKTQTLRNVKVLIEALKRDAYSNKVKEAIRNFNSQANFENILSVEDFLAVSAEPVKDDKKTYYMPSNGEQSMLVLNYALLDDSKKYFILDEPEMSVGHKYINQVIVPRLKELARQGKVVVVSTHDANIAIRTLPFQSIYREDLGSGKYTTYIGNPFIESMINYDDAKVNISWAKTSIDTLEGGRNAFNERGEAYGNENL